MTLYDKINTACKKGKHCIIKIPSGKYFIVSPFKDDGGDWRESYDNTFEGVSTGIGATSGVEPDGWARREAEGWTLEGYYYPEHEPYELGDKVRIRGEEEVWTVGNHDKSLNYYPLTRGDNEFMVSYHNNLEPVFEQERTIEDILNDLPEKDKAVIKKAIKD